MAIGTKWPDMRSATAASMLDHKTVKIVSRQYAKDFGVINFSLL